MWLNQDGMGGFRSSRPDTETWVRHSISAAHNQHWKGDSTYFFSDMVNSSAVFESLAYTSIIATGPRSAAITYNKYWPDGKGPNGAISKGWPGPSAHFVIQVAIGPSLISARPNTSGPLKSDDIASPCARSLAAAARVSPGARRRTAS